MFATRPSSPLKQPPLARLVVPIAGRPLLTLLMIIGCGGGGDTPTRPSEVPRVTVARVTVTPSTITLDALGATSTVQGQPVDSRGAAVPDVPVSWSVANSSVATVTGGVITAVGNGETTVTASAGGMSAVVAVTVRQRASTLVVLRQPSTVRAGVAFDSALVVELRDASGARLTSDNTTVVSAAISGDSSGVLAGGTATAIGGTVQFANLIVAGTARSATLQFSAPSGATVLSESFVLQPGNPSVLESSATEALEAPAGTTLATPLVVRVRDAWRNAVPGTAISFRLLAGEGTLSDTLLIADGAPPCRWPAANMQANSRSARRSTRCSSMFRSPPRPMA
jgi:hypothetical protein